MFDGAEPGLQKKREGGIKSDNSSFAKYEGVTKPS